MSSSLLINSRNGQAGKASEASGSSLALLAEAEFRQRLHFEQKRTERSRKGFVLMLLDCTRLLSNGSREALSQILPALIETSRETDIKGWHHDGAVLGVIFTEIEPAGDLPVIHLLSARTAEALAKSLGAGRAAKVEIALFPYPEPAGQEDGGPMRHPDAIGNGNGKQSMLRVKRALDVAGSLALLGVLSPLMVLIAVLVKLSSRGPVFFRQQRVGLYGKTFTFLKFRSMKSANDPSIHERFVQRFITESKSAAQANGAGKAIFKIKDDPRVTRVGRILRRTSLDELPQFFNVLQGHMSLVGPRPPIQYEVDVYDIWHKRRFLTVKPGITGLWQVTGRSKVSFDDMVRLDLRYARTWSLGMDLRILLLTPRAVIWGDGAF
jgi:lipopolysaccharide/colanic/teichoic acid biosynthesis glycosyltransferase